MYGSNDANASFVSAPVRRVPVWLWILPIVPAAIALIVLSGWAFDIMLLRRFVLRLPPMMPWSAVVVLILSAAQLWMNLGLRAESASRAGRARIGVVVFAGLGLLIAGIEAGEHLVGTVESFDTLLFHREVVEEAGVQSGRIALVVAFTYLLLGSALLLSMSRTPLYRKASAALTLAAIFAAVQAFVGYVFGTTSVFGVSGTTGMSLPTAISVLFLGLATLARVPDTPVMAWVNARDPAGALLRRLLAVSILVPFVLAFLVRVGHDAGLYDRDFGHSLFTVFTMIGLSAFSYWLVAQYRRTDQVRLRLLREEARLDEAESGLARRDEFLSIASHELKTPLTPLKLQIQLAQRLLGGSELTREDVTALRSMLSAADRQITRLSRLVQDMLDVSGITMGRILVIEPREADLAEIIHEVLAEYETQLRAAGSEVRLHLPKRVPGMLDSAKLRQLFLVLLSNATKFGAGRPIHIRVRVLRDLALISVRDHGKGLRPEEMRRIFNRFERLETGLDLAGFGLGLSVANGIVEAHQGSISVASRPGRGTVFRIRLPLRRSDEKSESDAAGFGLRTGESGRDSEPGDDQAPSVAKST